MLPPNAEMVMIAQEDKELAYVLNHCSLVVPDGAGILWAGEQLGTYFPARVAGADYAEEILKIAVKEKWPVYFLGGAPGGGRNGDSQVYGTIRSL